jgi:hypothetical protein
MLAIILTILNVVLVSVLTIGNITSRGLHIEKCSGKIELGVYSIPYLVHFYHYQT